MRTSTATRQTKETQIHGLLNLDGSGVAKVSTGIGMLDHLITALVAHARLDLELSCQGDLHVDDHHTVEDCALVLGELLCGALGDRAGIRRYGCAYAPLDEALARSVVDLCTRPFASVQLGLQRETLGTLATENLPHFLQSMAFAGRMTLHVDVLKGENDHHKAEAAFKSLALALRGAIELDPRGGGVSTKGVL
jgi:imidazoleglycerol phosphate dehydratase HisB